MRFLKYKFSRTISYSRRKGVKCDLDLEYFLYLYDIQQGKCFYTDMEMTCCAGKGIMRSALSIDRIIPENGYTKGNVVLCCNIINMSKTNLTLEEIEKWMPSWYIRITNWLNICISEP